jgi:glycosyltransferase involved in cell wall biosynthesis
VSDAPPAVTAVLLSHNCAAFIADALRSVLAQDCEPMEIIVSDDASGDETHAVIERELDRYTGPHRSWLRRRATNSGSKSAHLNDVFPLTSGRYLVSFDGDDVSEPHRVRTLVEAFRRDPTVTAVYSGYSQMDETGRPRERGRVPHPPPGTQPSRWFARVDAYAAGATLAVRRDVVEAFGALDPLINEDVVLPFRASLLGVVRYIDEDLVRVRRWQGSLTADADRFGSMDRYRARMLRGIAQARRQLDSRLEDLRKAERLGFDTGIDYPATARIAEDSMADAAVTADLVSPSFPTRLRCLARLARSGAYRHELPQNALLTFAPEAYLRYKRRKLGIGPHAHDAD